MKKIIAILTLMITTNINIKSMQFSISNGDYEIFLDEEHLRLSAVLKDFCQDSSKTVGVRSLFNLDYCRLSNYITKADLKRMKYYLNSIAYGAEIQQQCRNETMNESIKQLLLSDLFEIKPLLQAEIDSIVDKCINCQPTQLENCLQTKKLIALIPEIIKKDI